MLSPENLIFDKRKIQYCTKRIAYQILESNIDNKEIFLVGIADNGSVFAKDGQLFAGVYETIGELIPVYATLQESIDARITTRPSAILRQGTDVTNNDPRLNIPGTPQNLI